MTAGPLPPWLARAHGLVAAALAQDRMPQALLLQGATGIGKRLLADELARLVLCDHPGERACGRCASCRLEAAGSHPDLLRLELPAGKKQIPVDGVRELIEALGLKSYRGGRRVALIDPADALNRNGANALLKTLEEPGQGTLLILTVSRADHLPATIASRCQRLGIATPDRPAALAWLQSHDAATDWAPLLELAAGAPFGALGLAERGAGTLEEEMARLPEALLQPGTDVIALAERFQQKLPAERLRWIENWVTRRLREALVGPEPGHSAGNLGLPSVGRTRHIRALYDLLDELRTAQAALRGSANVTLLFERVLGLLARELYAVRAPRGR